MNIFFTCLFFLTASLSAASKFTTLQQIPAESQYLGVCTFKYEDAKRGRPILVEVWYPTEQPGPFAETNDPIWVHPRERRDAPLSQSRHPLILLSHGNRGDRRDRSWLAERLVKKGYIVASVEHFGNSWETFSPILTLRFWERAQDVSFALDQILQETSLKDRIDENRIGFVGYSLGGMTGLALAGAQASNLQEVLPKKLARYPEITPEVLAKIDLSEGTGNFRDLRIRALLLLAPATFVYTPQSLEKVKVPIGLVATLDDEILPHKEHAYQIIKHLMPAKLKLMRKKVSHFAFLNRVSETGKKIFNEALLYNPLKADPVHSEVADFALDFFRTHLK